MIDELRLVLRDIDSLGAGGALKIALSARRRAHIRERTHPTAAGPPMFEHREGHPAPPGAGTASRLPRGHGSLALSITGRDRFRPIARARHRNARLHARQRPDRRCLSIVRVTRHHPVLTAVNTPPTHLRYAMLNIKVGRAAVRTHVFRFVPSSRVQQCRGSRLVADQAGTGSKLSRWRAQVDLTTLPLAVRVVLAARGLHPGVARTHIAATHTRRRRKRTPSAMIDRARLPWPCGT